MKQSAFLAESQPVSDPLPAAAPTGLALVIERVVMDPSVDVTKLEKIIELQERMMRHHAKAQFDEAFAQMQGEIPIIVKRGEIEVNGQARSTFAKNEDIQKVIRPILMKHGFSLRHRNAFAEGGLKIIGILSHRGGHSEQDEFIGPADTSGSKNAIQAIGSTRQYGIRYTTISLLNIATEDEDDDGEAAGAAGRPTPPDLYDEWFDYLKQKAAEGHAAFKVAWEKAEPKHRDYITSHDLKAFEGLKRKAAGVKP